jgi:hypothetical protein
MRIRAHLARMRTRAHLARVRTRAHLARVGIRAMARMGTRAIVKVRTTISNIREF